MYPGCILTGETGPRLGLAKNSSFESLQAAVEQSDKMTYGDTDRSYYKPSARVSRSRGCNESFRAAVDRSYDPSGGAGGHESCMYSLLISIHLFHV